MVAKGRLLYVCTIYAYIYFISTVTDNSSVDPIAGHVMRVRCWFHGWQLRICRRKCHAEGSDRFDASLAFYIHVPLSSALCLSRASLPRMRPHLLLYVLCVYLFLCLGSPFSLPLSGSMMLALQDPAHRPAHLWNVSTSLTLYIHPCWLTCHDLVACSSFVANALAAHRTRTVIYSTVSTQCLLHFLEHAQDTCLRRILSSIYK